MSPGPTGAPSALVIHHDANSTAGIVGRRLVARGWTLHHHFVCTEPRSPVADGGLPTLDGHALVVLTGSQWSVYDHDTIGSWIGAELELVRRADALGVGVLGLCFGGQVLAAAHGGTVERAPVGEIGWHAIESSEPRIGGGPWFQWHDDRFHPPADATVLARSASCVQAFRLRRNLALQFHPELDPELLALWLQTDHDDLVAIGVDPPGLLRRTTAELERVTAATHTLVDWFLDDVAATAPASP